MSQLARNVAPPTQFYSCPCGYIVERSTYFRMMSNNNPLRCPGCNNTWHYFYPVAVEDYPTDDEYSAKVVYLDDFVVHLQGREEDAERGDES